MDNLEKSGEFNREPMVGVNTLLPFEVNQSQTWEKTFKMQYEACKIKEMTGRVIADLAVTADPGSVVCAALACGRSKCW